MDGIAEKLEEQWRKNAEAEGVETQQLEGEIALIRRLMREDAEFFIEFFLADSLDMPVPEFHKELWGLMTNEEKERVLLAIPRDHAKTTLSKLVVIWYWLHTSHRFCVYLSNTAPIAKNACRDIMEFLHTPNFVQVYGKIRVEKQSENEGLWIFHLPMPNGRSKRCILRALGQGQQMRGINIDNQRPDFAVVDDVEDNENTDSESQQKKLDRWMFGPFLKALARKKKILWLGNMLAKTSLLARLSRNARWNPVVFGSLVKDTATGALRALWVDKWLADDERQSLSSEEKNRLAVMRIMDDFREYKDAGQAETWMCEMMNMPGHSENGFTADMFNYQVVPNPDACECAWISIDPAFGLKAHNDETAISVHVIPKHSGVPMTVCVSHGHYDDHRMLHETLKLAEYWNAWVWGIESVAAQRVLISLFTVLLTQMGIAHLVQMLPLTAGRGDPKIGRIKAFVSLMSNGEWAIPESDVDITTQLLDLDLTKEDNDDDIVDSCAYGPAMMEQFLSIIRAMAHGDMNAVDVKPRVGMEVASV